MKKDSLPTAFTSTQSEDPVQMIQSLLGTVALIAVHPGTKKPVLPKWQSITSSMMDDPAYRASLKGMNLGVNLGKPSEGLCTIDIDRDEEVEPYLKNNPLLRNTLRTKRVRGCNIWIFMDGPYPPNRRLPFGEWRADGNQTLIWGSAIDRKKGETVATSYQFIHRATPIHLRFSDLVFREGCFDVNPPSVPTASAESCILNTTSLHSTSLHNNPELILKSIKARKQAIHNLSVRNPELVGLYTTLVENRYQPKPQERNAFIIQSVPFLYRAVAPSIVLEFVTCFYDCNAHLFHDPREQHIQEAQVMLASVTKTYADSLPTIDREIYNQLDSRQQDAFRICRDLAGLEDNIQKGCFYLAFNHLAARMAVYPPQAQRILIGLERFGILKQLVKGSKRGTGQPATAGTYQWHLSTDPHQKPDQPVGGS